MRFSVELTFGNDFVKTIRVEFVSLKAITVDPITVSFKEDVKGWVSFKSFVLENGVSTANDYYTILGGKLYKHHIENTNRNNFYGIDYNSSINVLLNDGPGSVKTFHTLDYEGSQSRVEGIRTVEVIGISPIYGSTGTEYYTNEPGKYFNFNALEMKGIYPTWSDGGGNNPIEIKQYRDGVLIFSGGVDVDGTWSDPPHGRKTTDSAAGDCIVYHQVLYNNH